MTSTHPTGDRRGRGRHHCELSGTGRPGSYAAAVFGGPPVRFHPSQPGRPTAGADLSARRGRRRNSERGARGGEEKKTMRKANEEVRRGGRQGEERRLAGESGRARRDEATTRWLARRKLIRRTTFGGCSGGSGRLGSGELHRPRSSRLAARPEPAQRIWVKAAWLVGRQGKVQKARRRKLGRKEENQGGRRENSAPFSGWVWLVIARRSVSRFS